MATFPTTLDALTNPISTNPLNSPDHAGQHSDANDILEALEAKVGVDASAVATSHDYKIATLATNNTGTNTGDNVEVAAQAVGFTITKGTTPKTLTVALDANVSGTNTGDTAANSTANTYADGKVADAINDGTTTIAPSQNAVFDALALKAPLTAPTFATSVTGSYLTASEVLITDASKNVVSAPVATYPSLAELAHVKGVTSAIQTQLGAALPKAGGTMTGDITLGENAAINLDPAGSADGKYTGMCIAGTAGATLAFGDLIYLAVATSKWVLTDADAVATAGGVLVGMCVLAANDTQATKILLQGQIRADAKFPALTIGAAVYVGETAGAIQVAIPTGADNIIRVVGFALTADEIYINVSNEWQVTVA